MLGTLIHSKNTLVNGMCLAPSLTEAYGLLEKTDLN